MKITGFKEKQEMQNNQHFFAASVMMWAQTTPECDLRELMKLMDKEGYGYNLFLVPLPYDSQYEINLFQPQVEGTKWLGFFDKKGKK